MRVYLRPSADRRHNKNAERNKDDDKVSLTQRFMPQQHQGHQRHQGQQQVKPRRISLKNADQKDVPLRSLSILGLQ